MPIPAGVPASTVVMTKSLPTCVAGISKYNREPTWCTPNTPVLLLARGVMTVA